MGNSPGSCVKVGWRQMALFVIKGLMRISISLRKAGWLFLSQTVLTHRTWENHDHKQWGDFSALSVHYTPRSSLATSQRWWKCTSSFGHAEQIPIVDLQKQPQDVFYLPMHAVHKETSMTTKIRVVFDASTKSSSGASLNKTRMVRLTMHSTLVDISLRFWLYRVTVTADISKMYCAIKLFPAGKDYHQFVWRRNDKEPLLDRIMNRLFRSFSVFTRSKYVSHQKFYRLCSWKPTCCCCNK